MSTATRVPLVVLTDGDDASGFAEMLGALLEQNLRDFPTRAAIASRLRGEVAFVVSDHDLTVNLAFGRCVVGVRDGSGDNRPELRGPWLTMADVCSGRTSPLRAWRDRVIEFVPRGHPLRGILGAFTLSVPLAFYDPAAARQRNRRAAAVAAAAVAVVVVGVVGVVGVGTVARRGSRR